MEEYLNENPWVLTTVVADYLMVFSAIVFLLSSVIHVFSVSWMSDYWRSRSGGWLTESVSQEESLRMMK